MVLILTCIARPMLNTAGDCVARREIASMMYRVLGSFMEEDIKRDRSIKFPNI